MILKRLAGALIAGMVVTEMIGGAFAEDDAALKAETEKALNASFTALATGDPEKVRLFLAPEFQVQRSDGKGYDKESYLARSMPKILTHPTYRDLVVTRNGDIVVARFMIEIEETINGQKVERESPQLMVFRVTPERWQVVAAA